ncbi:hypothetical protein Dda_1248 [Drechslerella dactyloides]|uniref:Uncharacterized protein n=1 Tax=Drechslerella dactyloides TaxID=74499 RepID=A0AAD6J5X7_DREDA|nr:hypothetical protein Dda_1248 [Drechslerella dactyloides]
MPDAMASSSVPSAASSSSSLAARPPPEPADLEPAAASKKARKKKSGKRPQLNGIDTSSAADPKAPASSSTSSAPPTATTTSARIPPSPAMSSASSKSKDGTAGSLIICRNKHWRYISSFHGPWLQLPPEVLESLAYHNWGTPRPHPIDPAVFFDIVKIRRLVDEATTISVRAASGVASSSSSYNSSAASLMGGGNAAILGIGFTNPNSNAKLSRERKHRMRELATQKLAKAYALDEIAASVATMQGASTLEDVASFVLQRNPHDVEAKYVHFFHEKIPSRMLAASTSLIPLDQVIFERPYDGWALRTRAVTKGFKEDHAGAAADLTTALKRVRSVVHDGIAGAAALGDVFGANGSVSSTTSAMNASRGSRGTGSGSGGGPGPSSWDGVTRDEATQPTSLEMQLLFHRASSYLTLACQKIEAFNALGDPQKGGAGAASVNGNGVPAEDAAAIAAKREMVRKAIRANSKKAIRDYLKYLSYFDYTPGLTVEEAEEQLRQNIQAVTRSRTTKAIEPDSTKDKDSTANTNGNSNGGNGNGSYSRARIPAPRGPVYAVATLFTSPPSTLPPYPAPASTELTKYTPTPQPAPPPQPGSMLPVYEQITYHPLLTDALHSLLLCHAIISTPAKEIQRYAFMAARLARICDGYPIFLAARSPARADWIELIRRVGDWMSLGRSWESLCQPAPLPPVFERDDTVATTTYGNNGTSNLTAVQYQVQHIPTGGGSSSSANTPPAATAPPARQIAGSGDNSNMSSDALSALMGGDESGGGLNISGIASPGVGQREHSQVRGAKRWAQEDGKEYPISTERAAVIARFVKEEMRRAKEAAERVKAREGERDAAAAAAGLAREESVDVEELVFGDGCSLSTRLRMDHAALVASILLSDINIVCVFGGIYSRDFQPFLTRIRALHNGQVAYARDAFTMSTKPPVHARGNRSTPLRPPLNLLHCQRHRTDSVPPPTRDVYALSTLYNGLVQLTLHSTYIVRWQYRVVVFRPDYCVEDGGLPSIEQVVADPAPTISGLYVSPGGEGCEEGVADGGWRWGGGVSGGGGRTLLGRAHGEAEVGERQREVIGEGFWRLALRERFEKITPWDEGLGDSCLGVVDFNRDEFFGKVLWQCHAFRGVEVGGVGDELGMEDGQAREEVAICEFGGPGIPQRGSVSATGKGIGGGRKDIAEVTKEREIFTLDVRPAACRYKARVDTELESSVANELERERGETTTMRLGDAGDEVAITPQPQASSVDPTDSRRNRVGLVSAVMEEPVVADDARSVIATCSLPKKSSRRARLRCAVRSGSSFAPG